jgi:hypothetical protein
MRFLACGEIRDLNFPEDGELLKQIKPRAGFEVQD